MKKQIEELKQMVEQFEQSHHIDEDIKADYIEKLNNDIADLEEAEIEEAFETLDAVFITLWTDADGKYAYEQGNPFYGYLTPDYEMEVLLPFTVRTESLTYSDFEEWLVPAEQQVHFIQHYGVEAEQEEPEVITLYTNKGGEVLYNNGSQFYATTERDNIEGEGYGFMFVIPFTVRKDDVEFGYTESGGECFVQNIDSVKF